MTPTFEQFKAIIVRAQVFNANAQDSSDFLEFLGLAGLGQADAQLLIRRLSDFYRQEFSLNNAEDFAETLSLNEVVLVRVGSFNHCLKSEETTPLEPDLLEDKFYAPGDLETS